LATELAGLSPPDLEGIATALQPLVALLVAKVGSARAELQR
jgi:hypothetical protein